MPDDADVKPGVAQAWPLTWRTPDVAYVAYATDATDATDATYRHHRHRLKISRLQGIKKDPVGNNTAQGLTRAHGLFYKVKPLRKNWEKRKKSPIKTF